MIKNQKSYPQGAKWLCKRTCQLFYEQKIVNYNKNSYVTHIIHMSMWITCVNYVESIVNNY
jgi:hypothetical protein